jgi:hypothetical protein
VRRVERISSLRRVERLPQGVCKESFLRFRVTRKIRKDKAFKIVEGQCRGVMIGRIKQAL